MLKNTFASAAGGWRKSTTTSLSTRQWTHENRAAEAFWNDHIAPLDEKTRDEVISHLPSINRV